VAAFADAAVNGGSQAAAAADAAGVEDLFCVKVARRQWYHPDPLSPPLLSSSKPPNLDFILLILQIR
jgi:hypothetical protein